MPMSPSTRAPMRWRPLAERRRAGGHHALSHPEVPAAGPGGRRRRHDGGGGHAAAPARPAMTQDNAFWFEGARAHKLLIQRCTSCGTLRHPPLPACGNCRSFDWDTVEAERSRHALLLRGGALPPGARLRLPASPSGWWSWRKAPAWWPTSTGSLRDELQIGLPLQARFVDFDDELSLPVFVRAGGRLPDERREAA